MSLVLQEIRVQVKC